MNDSNKTLVESLSIKVIIYIHDLGGMVSAEKVSDHINLLNHGMKNLLDDVIDYCTRNDKLSILYARNVPNKEPDLSDIYYISSKKF